MLGQHGVTADEVKMAEVVLSIVDEILTDVLTVGVGEKLIEEIDDEGFFFFEAPVVYFGGVERGFEERDADSIEVRPS